MSQPYELVPSQVWMRVFHIAGEHSADLGYGSATILELDGRQVLVTADHLTTGEPDECFHLHNGHVTKEESVSVTLERLTSRVEDVDVAIYDFPRSIFDLSRYPLPSDAVGVFPTQNVFLLGHPYGLYLQLSVESPKVRMPLTKRGILAGGKWIGPSHYFFVDCIANPGFSGGPAVFRNVETGDWQMLGVVKGQFKQDASAEGDSEGEAREPAGISAVAELNTARVALGVGPGTLA